MPLSVRYLLLLLSTSPFFLSSLHAALSNIVNVGLVRRNEMVQGIHVSREDGTIVGQSAKAGQRAAASVASVLSLPLPSRCPPLPAPALLFSPLTGQVRIISAMPLMVFVPLILARLGTLPLFQARPFLLKGPVNLSLVGLALQLGLPAASALFPQRVGVDARQLEPAFHALQDAQGQPVKMLYYNRGL